MKKLFVFIILTLMLSSCNFSEENRSYDDLNKHKGEVVVSRKTGNKYCLYLKKENDANLVIVSVSYGEYNYYKDGDTIK